MFLHIREMIVGGPSRLRFVFRYSTTRVYYRESVAEHSYFTALYSMLVAKWVEENDTTLEGRADSPHSPDAGIDMGGLLQRALIHDLEEARSGDFPRSFKHSDPQLRTMLEEASKTAFKQIVYPLIKYHEKDTPHVDMPDGTAIDLLDMWVDAKDATTEGAILEFADFLSVLGFLLQEGAGAGNKAILEHVEDMCKYFTKFKDDRFTFLRPLIDQAREIMLELFPNAQL